MFLREFEYLLDTLPVVPLDRLFNIYEIAFTLKKHRMSSLTLSTSFLARCSNVWENTL